MTVNQNSLYSELSLYDSPIILILNMKTALMFVAIAALGAAAITTAISFVDHVDAKSCNGPNNDPWLLKPSTLCGNIAAFGNG